ncbi:class I SAM-dependent methyltransferase, partial [Candidatus Bathyarchaeota archaeon]|nr:class I SAM-dependent methyltransferase [Candidatus Bathyarchaeota archaeon]
REILSTYKLSDGIAIDIGCGSGWMGIELARLSGFNIILLDLNREEVSKAYLNAHSVGVSDKIFPIVADAHHLPFKDEVAILIVSRGSIFFWDKPAKALRDSYRVLNKNGIAFIGGGFGKTLPRDIRKKIYEEVKRTIRQNNAMFKKWRKGRSFKVFNGWIHEAGLSNYRIIKNSFDIWVEIRKKEGN